MAAVTISKLDAASRQLDTAIRMLFAAGDPVAIHTLSASAANVFFDVADRRKGAVSWRGWMAQDNKLSEKEVTAALHKSWNFFKHADRDPESVLEFDPRESEDLMFMAVLQCGDLGKPTTYAMQVFQLWYMAAYKAHVADFVDFVQVFPGLASLDRTAQIERGAAALKEIPPGDRLQ